MRMLTGRMGNVERSSVALWGSTRGSVATLGNLVELGHLIGHAVIELLK